MTEPVPSGRECLAGVCGFLGVLLNLVAVGALWGQPHVYKPGDVGGWLEGALAAPTATTVSAWCFTLGLAFLVAFCAGLGRRDRGVLPGAALFAAGALLDAAGTLGLVAALHVDRPIAEALLWLTLLLDSCFNVLLGLGLLFMAAGMHATHWPRGLRALTVVAGLASLPVGLQFTSDTFAAVLMFSGPLWLAWALWSSAALFTAVKTAP